MAAISQTSTAATPSDQILPITRLVSAIIVPFLVLAFGILYLYPDQSGKYFAWDIQPRIQAMFVGAGYIGGSYLFIRTIFGRRWSRVAAGFPAVTTFTVSMLLLTILHWDYFDLTHFPFQVWLVLYIITPVLVPWLWLHNRHVDSGTLHPGDVLVPGAVRVSMSILGIVLMGIALLGFIFPDWLIGLWPWALNTLSAQAMSGWLALLGVGGMVIAREHRWSAWRFGLESIAIWHLLVLLAAVLNPSDFVGGTLLNWYIISVVAVVAGMIILYIWMERRRRLLSR